MKSSESSPDITLKQLYEEILNSKNEVQGSIDEVRSSISTCEARIVLEFQSLKNRIKELEEENTTLKGELEYVDRTIRKNNIVIFGLNTSNGQITPQQICNKINQVIEVELEEKDISDCYRLGKAKNCPVKVELISHIKKKAIFSRVKHLRGSTLSIANDLTKQQREDSKVLRAGLLRARANPSVRSYIRGNRLIVDDSQYTVEDLVNAHEEEKSHSALPTPTTSFEQLVGEDTNESDWRNTEVLERTAAPSKKTESKSSTLKYSPKAYNIQKNKKKSSTKKDSKPGMKLRTNSERQ